METKKCEFCKSPFYRRLNEKLCRFQARRFCSIRCRNLHNARLKKAAPLITKICPNCNSLFQVPCWNSKQVFCSASCAASGTNNPNSKWTAQQIQLLESQYPLRGAAWCAEHLPFSPQQILSKASRCSLKLTQKARSNVVGEVNRTRMLNKNPMKDPEVAAKCFATRKTLGVHEKTLKKLQAACHAIIREKPSKLQKKFYDALSKADIQFEKEYLIKPKFYVDAAIPKASIILQVDGCYWHGCPDHFPELSKQQEKQKARDRAQDKYLTGCGWTILRFWECKINNELENCIKRVQRVLI